MGVILGDINPRAMEALINEAKIGEPLPERLRNYLGVAFWWVETPQGHDYWSDIKMGKEKWSLEDTAYLASLIDCEESETEDIQWA